MHDHDDELLILGQVKYANQKDLPFLVYNGAHGAITTLGKMTHGIEIYLDQLGSVQIAEDGQTATFGGGIQAKNVTDALWAAGKQTGESKPQVNTQWHAIVTQSWDANLAGDSYWNLRVCQPSWARAWRWPWVASGTSRTRRGSVRFHEYRVG